MSLEAKANSKEWGSAKSATTCFTLWNKFLGRILPSLCFNVLSVNMLKKQKKEINGITVSISKIITMWLKPRRLDKTRWNFIVDSKLILIVLETLHFNGSRLNAWRGWGVRDGKLWHSLIQPKIDWTLFLCAQLAISTGEKKNLIRMTKSF